MRLTRIGDLSQGRLKRCTESEIEELLENKFSREIHFSNKSFRRSHQKMSWKLAGATNWCNLIVKLQIYSFIFRNTSFWLFPKIEDCVKRPFFHKHANHITCKYLFLRHYNLSFCNLLISVKHTSTPSIFFKTRKFVESH